jgi:quinol monooxygenase YgiN
MMTAYALKHSPAAVGVLSLWLLLSGTACAEKDENPIGAQLKTALKDPSKPFTLVVQLKVKDGAQEKFEAAFAKASKATHKEKGCLAYDLSRDAKDSTRYVIYERWKSLSDMEAHLDSAYGKQFLSDLIDAVVGTSEVKILLPVGE